ncbi:hypothetical protein N5U04_10055 [Aliarcobacter butzleri]|uniref:hypothetical protein n=1 Tax=Aliarcobacter butzleri TaxID=28197 RepID=UPI0021B400F0|nr:hypothetical protein [Aliarcobacter butzleri]MCT7550942.1 hypothetical protein [Aliarcobacter butzleri]MCT7559912.1 hypothetical protein [Aliarcobacter butzleri]
MKFFSKSKKKKVAFLCNCQGGIYKHLLSLDNEYYKYYDMHKAEIKGWIEFNLVNTEDEIERMILENFNTLSS